MKNHVLYFGLFLLFTILHDVSFGQQRQPLAKIHIGDDGQIQILENDSGEEKNPDQKKEPIRSNPLRTMDETMAKTSTNPGMNVGFDPANCEYDLDDWHLTIRVRVVNKGTEYIFTVRTGFYLSANSNINGSEDILLGDESSTYLTTNPASNFDNIEVTYDVSAYPGTWYVGFFVDYNNALTEDNENDNEDHFTPKIELYSDLIASFFLMESFSFNPSNYEITYGAGYENEGNADAIAPFVIHAYLSTNTAIKTEDILIGNFTRENNLRPQWGTIYTPEYYSAEHIPPGDYYLGTIVDVYDQVKESNEINNTAHFKGNTITIPTPSADPPAAPILDSPANGATGVSLNPTLDWHAGNGPSVDKYKLVVTLQSGGNIYNNDNISSSHRQIGPLESNTTYCWKVKGYNSDGWGTYSEEWTFITATEDDPDPSVKSWYQQTSGVGNRLNSVDAVSQYAGWACGNNHTILKTLDSGKTWQDATGNIPDLSFVTIDALDEHTALVAGYQSGDYKSYIYKTSNGGDTWTSVYGPNGFINHIHMFDESSGRAVGDPVNNTWTVLKTSNGGDSWSLIPGPPFAVDGDYGYPYGVSWHSDQAGWFGTNTSKAYFTPDRGVQWLNQPIPELVRITSIAFEPAGINGLACSESDGNMARSSDSGANWENITPPQNGAISYIHHADNTFWILITGDIYSSNNHGTDWNHETTAPANLRDISFHGTDENRTGWAVGNAGVIMRYGDESTGILWQKNKTVPESPLLFSNYPNPFNAMTTITFYVPKKTFVEIRIYNIYGRELLKLVPKHYEKGYYETSWDAEGLSSGIYIAQIKAGSFTASRKLILQK